MIDLFCEYIERLEPVHLFKQKNYTLLDLGQKLYINSFRKHLGSPLNV